MRPLNLGETLDASIKIVRERWRTLATVMVVVALPIQLLDILIVSSTTDVYEIGTGLTTGSGSSSTTYSDEGAYIAGQLAMQLLSVLGYLIGTVACYRAIADSYLGRRSSAADSLRFAARRLGATLWLTILLVVGLVCALFALVVPAIWLAIAWSVAIPALLVEGRGGAAALKRSFALVKDRWWSTLGRLAVAYILVTVVTGILTVVLLVPAVWAVDSTSFGALVLEHLANFAVSLVTTPFLAAVITLVYFDLRVRKEGFDLALLAERMGGAPAEAPAPGLAPAGRREGRDAFGNALTSVPPPAPRPAAAPAPPGGWAPPVAPEPHRPSSPPDE
ncbi:MAG TPA: hypothetical protein VK501_17785 [Baekduia sp.]|uniref:hypothetical protein n=1 Tax=Baekduia sp. TaxID=2600305 RepID=UPI002BC63935|nr:hypothetical protein [Baekduia sp.]HMJ35760.1 hypothetical protein [Baekduia sp.]